MISSQSSSYTTCLVSNGFKETSLYSALQVTFALRSAVDLYLLQAQIVLLFFLSLCFLAASSSYYCVTVNVADIFQLVHFQWILQCGDFSLDLLDFTLTL